MVRATFREQMLALQREVYARNQDRIAKSVYGYTAAYRRYEKEYRAAVARYQSIASFDELLNAINEADLIYIGDYHTLAQAQRTVVRLLRRLPLDAQPTLAVEFVQGRHQAALDAFLAGRIAEHEFLKRIDHDPSGVFGAWEHFKPIFDFAGDHRLPMVGIDLVHGQVRPNLRERDAFAAKQIVDAIESRPNKAVVVHTGELHVGPSHLPLAVDRELKRRGISKLRRVIVYQNCETLYRELEDRALEHEAEVLRVRSGEYCVMTTPPIVAQQSYLSWLDQDDDFFDDARPEKTFKEYVEIIARVLGIRIGDALDNVVVSSVIDVHFLDTLRRRGKFSAKELEEIRRQILRNESYFIPKANMVFLGHLSINHAAEEASHFLRHISGGDEEPRYLVDAFYYRVLNEAVGFLGSKLINHKRKCPHPMHFQRMIDEVKRGVQKRSPFEMKVADYVIKHAQMERGKSVKGLRDLYTTDADTFNAVTHALGYILGDKLYYAMVEGIVSKNDARELYYDNLEEDGAALSTYLALAGRVEKVKLPRRVL